MKKNVIYIIFFFLLACNPSVEKQENNPAIEEKQELPNIVNKDQEKKNINNKQNKKEDTEKETPIKKIEQYNFTKGIYLSAYTVSSNRFETILDSAEAAGINTVVFDLKNMKGRVFFSVPQKDSLRAERVDRIVNIKKTVKALHDRDMRAVARLVMFHDRFVAMRDSTVRPKSSSGKPWRESSRIDPSWLDPSLPSVQNELLEIIELAAKNKVDEIQLDYIRFPTQGSLDDAVFYFIQQDSLLVKQDSLYQTRSKIDIITSFVKDVYKVCKKYEVSLTADIFAIVAWQRKADVQNTGQDIGSISRYLDSIHPMIYSSHFSDGFGFRRDVANEPYHMVYKAAKLTRRYAETGCKVIPYIQANSWRVN
ncbi:MAG: putative glycoside hydrolase, partial [Candidatus Cloacimonadota bacterium]|nr:putative glycoside hydrolase [Candidatus Cloacimonadota bacterium]